MRPTAKRWTRTSGVGIPPQRKGTGLRYGQCLTQTGVPSTCLHQTLTIGCHPRTTNLPPDRREVAVLFSCCLPSRASASAVTPGTSPARQLRRHIHAAGALAVVARYGATLGCDGRLRCGCGKCPEVVLRSCRRAPRSAMPLSRHSCRSASMCLRVHLILTHPKPEQKGDAVRTLPRLREAPDNRG